MPLFRAVTTGPAHPPSSSSEPLPPPSSALPDALSPPGVSGPHPGQVPAVRRLRPGWRLRRCRLSRRPGDAIRLVADRPFPGHGGEPPCHAEAAPTTTACSATTSTGGAGAATPPVPHHWATVGGIVYCRRHAGTIAAIGYFDHPSGCPTSTTAPLAGQLGGTRSRRLRGRDAGAERHAGETFVREPVVSTHADRSGGRRYERGWKLVDHTGLRLVVAVFVVEGEETTIRVRVGSGVVAEGVPPWIERHRRGSR